MVEESVGGSGREASVSISPDEFSHLIDEGDGLACAVLLGSLESSESARLVDRLSEAHRERLVSMLEPELAARVLGRAPESQAAEAIEGLPPDVAARVLEEFPSDRRADLLGELEPERATAILDQMSAADAAAARRLASYDDDVAGGLMITEYLSYEQNQTVADLLADLADHQDLYRDFGIQYIYVTDRRRRLVGVLRVRDLLLAARRAPLRTLMIEHPLSVPDEMDLDELRSLFADRPFIGLPVVDTEERLLGVIRRSAVMQAITDEAAETYRAAQGIVGGEELRSMPLLLRARRRLAWLSINIVLNILAASVIAMHQDTLEAVIALAVFLPIISDMSGCSGNQAVAVSMRELTLGVLRPNEVLRVLGKEVLVGLVNGLVLGLLIGVVAYAWKGNVYLGGVVGTALMLNTILAVAIGGSVPLVLKGFKMDPALASGPILTTVTDMCGFFLVLTFASMAMGYLV